MDNDGLQLKRPRAILLDVASTMAKSGFVDEVLLGYVSHNVKSYLEENWHLAAVQSDVANLRAEAKKQAITEPATPQIGHDNGARVAQIETTVRYVHYCLEQRKPNDAMLVLQFHMWFAAFKKDRLQLPFNPVAAKQLRKWHHDFCLATKLYVLSNGWAAANRRFLAKTSHGDLSILFEDFFDAASVGPLTNPHTYLKVLAHINETAAGTLYLTKNADAALAAVKSGLTTVLVLPHRRHIQKLQGDAKKLPRVRLLSDIEFVE